MEVVLGILLAVAVIAAIVLFLQVGPARAASAKSQQELDSVRSRLSALESEAKKSTEALEAKRRENEELKERLKDTKKRKYEEREAAKLKNDVELARAEIEREFEHKLAKAREEAEEARVALKKVAAEADALRSRKPVRVEEPKAAPVVVEKRAEEARPVQPREATPEEKARAETAEKALAKAKQKMDELEAEVKKARGRAETDRRVFLVQKSEVEIAKDKYRSLETKFNALSLEREELRKALFTLEKEMKALRPTAEAAKPAEPAAATPAEKSETAGA